MFRFRVDHYLSILFSLFLVSGFSTLLQAGNSPLSAQNAADFGDRSRSLYDMKALFSSAAYKKARLPQKRKMIQEHFIQNKWNGFFSKNISKCLLYSFRSLVIPAILLLLYVYSDPLMEIIGKKFIDCWLGSLRNENIEVPVLIKGMLVTPPDTFNKTNRDNQIYLGALLSLVGVTFFTCFIVQKKPYTSSWVLNITMIYRPLLFLFYLLLIYLKFIIEAFRSSFLSPLARLFTWQRPTDPLEEAQLFYLIHKEKMLAENPTLVNVLEARLVATYKNYSPETIEETIAYLKRGVALFLATRGVDLKAVDREQLGEKVYKEMGSYAAPIKKAFSFALKSDNDLPLCIIGAPGTGKKKSISIVQNIVGNALNSPPPPYVTISFFQQIEGETVRQLFFRQMADQFLAKLAVGGAGEQGLLLIHLEEPDKMLMSSSPKKDKVRDFLLDLLDTDRIYCEEYKTSFPRGWVVLTINHQLYDAIQNRCLTVESSFDQAQKAQIMFQEGLLERLCKEVGIDPSKLTEQDKEGIENIIKKQSQLDKGLRSTIRWVKFYLREKTMAGVFQEEAA